MKMKNDKVELITTNLHCMPKSVSIDFDNVWDLTLPLLSSDIENLRLKEISKVICTNIYLYTFRRGNIRGNIRVTAILYFAKNLETLKRRLSVSLKLYFQPDLRAQASTD